MKNLLPITAALVCLSSASLHAKDKNAITDLETAITEATSQKKAVFIVYGREACGNCRALHNLIDTKKLTLPKSQYLVADINCDDPAQGKAFRARYQVDGKTLPFVVVAAPNGELLASRTGYGSLAEYSTLLRDAKKQAKALESKKP